MAYNPIENYGIIGDLNTVALVGINGSIDFMCFPRFDSPTIFASILDDEKGGCFQIGPRDADEANRKQLYLPETNVLISRFLSEEGVIEVSDFMPVEEMGPANILIRRVKVVRGKSTIRMRCAPRFDYARVGHETDQTSETEILFISEKSADNESQPLTLRLVSSHPMTLRDGDAYSEISLETNEHMTFVLEEVKEGEESPIEEENYVSEAFKATVNFWRRWIGRSTYKGRWRHMVNRSALALKLLTSWDHGSIVAAPTFGLPETVGGGRNWDYRYSWIRDSSFTLYAFMRLGLFDEAERYMHWIEERCTEQDPKEPLQPVYAMDGSRRITETTLDHLEGYKQSQPVRIGNSAWDQFQMDIYGELLDTVYLYDKYGSPISHGLWEALTRLIEWVSENWQRKDDGIWEIRAEEDFAFLHSRVMSWVTMDRAVRLMHKRGLPGPLNEWRTARDAIFKDIYENFWDEERQAFVQNDQTSAVDASSLLMPLVRFISPEDPRWLSTMEAIKEELVSDSLVYRYRQERGAPDGLEGTEGTFCMCSFWYIECLARAGDINQARLLFDKMLGYANHLGLYAEEIGLHGEHLGNFPQALTHLALISTAYELDRRLSQAGWEA